MKIKKVPRYLALSLLTSGASLIIGFLSFSGMLAIWPSLPAAYLFGGLSVAYEGEVILQNIKRAWSKQFGKNHLERQLANDYLLEQMSNTPQEEYPAFFKDYEAQLLLFDQFGHHRLSKASKARKEQIEKTLRDMEKWFALQLFVNKKKAPTDLSPYELDLQNWLERHDQDKQQTLLKRRRTMFHLALAFSALSAVFMSLGTTYLLVEAFSIIPLVAGVSFALWPIFIIPMAVVAGIAYGFLTYNALTDMIANDTIRKWFNNIRTLLKEPMSFRKIFIPAATLFLIALGIALTLCTAGTWWTVAKEARPLFAWMSKLPNLILMGIINPIITGLSSMVFIFQNTSETLDLLSKGSKNLGQKTSNFFKGLFKSIADAFQELRKRENWFQIFNPFRLILTIVMLPLRIILFFGHIIGIGVTSDRVPGIPHIVSAIAGAGSETFEDAHYFLGHDHDHDHDHTHTESHSHEHHDESHDCHEHLLEDHDDHADHRKAILEERLGHEHGHNHDVDLPTRFLKLIFSPIYFLAASWDYSFSKLNGNILGKPQKVDTFNHAWEKQNDIKAAKQKPLPTADQQPSTSWKMLHTIYRIERYKEKKLTKASQQPQRDTLTGIQQQLRVDLDDLKIEQKQAGRPWRYQAASFFRAKERPEIDKFLNQTLPERVNCNVMGAVTVI